MSIENAKALVAKAKEDPALAKKLSIAADEGDEGFEKVAAEVGFPCNRSHMEEAFAPELSDMDDSYMLELQRRRDQTIEELGRPWPEYAPEVKHVD